MGINNKKGITVTSIVVYVILFFMFTTITSIISSRFNENLFNDRGMAINITEFNKLEYNLLESASNSYNATYETEENITTITFSNSDEYVFDKENQIIYKNGGKLIKHVKDYTIITNEALLSIDLLLNKYTNQVERNININILIKES